MPHPVVVKVFRRSCGFLLVAGLFAAACEPVMESDVTALLFPLIESDRTHAAGDTLRLPLRVTDASGKALGGVTVRWAVEGGGEVTASSTVTSPEGLTSTVLIVGEGANRVVAGTSLGERQAIFTAHGCARCGEWVSVPVALAGRSRAWAGAAAVGDRVWVFGGERSSYGVDEIDVFDSQTADWDAAGHLPVVVGGAQALAYHDMIFLVGGFDPGLLGSGYQTVFALDPNTGSLARKASLERGRLLAAAAVLDGRIHVAGGYPSCDFYWGCGTFTVGGSFVNGPLASLEIYDPGADRWSEGAPMHYARAIAGAAVLDGRLYVVGGIRGDWWFDSPVSHVERYDPADDRWVILSPLPGYGPVELVATRGRLYAMTFTGLPFTRVFEYEPTTDSWTRLADGPTLIGPAVAAAPDGIYVIGGYAEYSDRPFVRRHSEVVWAFRP